MARAFALVGACLAFGLALRAEAGGPLIVDPPSRTGYHFGPTPVPVYYDLGPLGITYDWSTGTPKKVVFNNAVGANLVTHGYGSWSGVATTSLRTSVKGTFALKGLPNIDASNVTKILGTSNGRGIYVIFDADGSIMQDVLGVSDGVLGIASPQFAQPGTTVITESFVVLNGSAIQPQDTGAAAFQGVATHEFGHSLGLAHSQVNGSTLFFFNPAGPASCSALPYAGTPASTDVETMFPYVDPTPGTGTGVSQGTVHTLDDMAAISDLYPAAGWPRSYGTVSGKVYDLNGSSELTGVNVVARSLSNPFSGATSAITGDHTQGYLGADGSFVIHGLVPGEQYVVYVDALVAGGFSTPPQWFLPGSERFYLAPSASATPPPAPGAPPGASAGFDPCRFTVVTARAGATTDTSVRFEHLLGAPILYQLGYGTGVTGLSGDGSVAVGDYGRGGPIFRWSPQTGVMPTQVISTGETTSISPNGKYIASNVLDPATDSSRGAFRWDASNGWQPVAPLGSCDSVTTTNFSVDNNGSVYGLTYTDNTCMNYRGFRWNPATGTVLLPSPGVKPDGTPTNTRINRASATGKTLVGWQEDPLYGIWEGVVWNADVPSLVRTPRGDIVDEITGVSPDGTVIGGALLDGSKPLGDGYLRNATGGTMRWIKPLPGDASPAAPNALSQNAVVVAGFSGNPFLSFNPGPIIWTRQMGTANLDDFVRKQGTAMDQWVSLWEPIAISGNGKVIGGWGVGDIGGGGWVLNIDKAFVCHLEVTAGAAPASQTLSVDFPTDFDAHLAHGDTVGRCP